MQPVAVLLDRLPIPGGQLRLGSRIPRLRELQWILEVRADHLAQTLRVHQPKRDPATQRGIRARPGIAQQRNPGEQRPPVNDRTAVAVGQPAHRLELADRLPLQPVRMQRARLQDGPPQVGVAHPLEHLVAAGGNDGHRPRAVIRRESQDPEGPDRRQQRAKGCGVVPSAERKNRP